MSVDSRYQLKQQTSSPWSSFSSAQALPVLAAVHGLSVRLRRSASNEGQVNTVLLLDVYRFHVLSSAAMQSISLLR